MEKNIFSFYYAEIKYFSSYYEEMWKSWWGHEYGMGKSHKSSVFVNSWHPWSMAEQQVVEKHLWPY